MDMLKKLWPTPFKIERKNLSSFLIQLIIFKEQKKAVETPLFYIKLFMLPY